MTRMKSLNLMVLSFAASFYWNDSVTAKPCKPASKEHFWSPWSAPELCQKNFPVHVFQRPLAKALGGKWPSFHVYVVLPNVWPIKCLINLNITWSIIENSFCTNSFKKNSLSCTLTNSLQMHTFWTCGIPFFLISNCKNCRDSLDVRSVRR